jgi:prepilin-type N-terminal cleavage/methylation domain-containing protein
VRIVRHRDCHGFTLIELIAAITIMAILAAVALPRMTAAQPFTERGYADTVAAALRQARAVAYASDCAVQFTIDAAGHRALQRAAGASNHCAAAGAFSTPVRRGDGDNIDVFQPAGITLAASRQFIFAPDGTAAGGPFAIDIGPQAIVVNASGVVTGP